MLIEIRKTISIIGSSKTFKGMKCFIDIYAKLFSLTTFLCVIITKKNKSNGKAENMFCSHKIQQKKKANNVNT